MQHARMNSVQRVYIEQSSSKSRLIGGNNHLIFRAGGFRDRLEATGQGMPFLR